MACPDFKNRPKTGLRPLGVKVWIVHGVEHEVANSGILAMVQVNSRL
jgi:hypothetical protein